MTVENLFAAWWLMFGQYFQVRLGFAPTKKEIARHAFEAGVEAGKSPAVLREEEGKE